jgi:hypothetical protein
MKIEMTPVEQITELYTRTKGAIKVLALSDNFKDSITEGEVKFRYETVSGFLLMAINDIGRCMQVWRDEEIKEAAQGIAKSSAQQAAGQNADGASPEPNGK